MITAGTYKARVTGECVLGESNKKGTPFIEFYLSIIGGENNGGRVRWTGYFTENTNERSIQALQTCGWQGEDLSEFSDGQLHGLDANEVDIVVELEEYEVVDKGTGQKTGERRAAPRVAWINKSGGFLNVDAAMTADKAAAFGERMRGLVLQQKAKAPVKGTGTDFAFGANAAGAAPPASGDAPPKAF